VSTSIFTGVAPKRPTPVHLPFSCLTEVMTSLRVASAPFFNSCWSSPCHVLT